MTEDRSDESLNVTEKLRPEDEEEIATWAAKVSIIQPLKKEQIRMFLHSCYYNVEDTKVTIKSYYNLRINSLRYFTDRDIDSENLRIITSQFVCGRLPGTTKDGYKVLILGFLDGDFSNFTFVNCVKFIMMAYDMWISQDDGLCPGYIVLAEKSYFSYRILSKCDLESLKKILSYFQDALPVRLKKLILVNIPTATNVLIKMLKPFMAKRVVEMLHTYSRGDDSYTDFVPPEMLPKDLQGTYKSLKEIQEDTIEELRSYKEWFKDEDEIWKELCKKQPPTKSRSFWGISY